jgi:hypothetical protein
LWKNIIIINNIQTYHDNIELEGVLSQFMAWVVEDVASCVAPPVPPPSHFHRRNLEVFDILKR